MLAKTAQIFNKEPLLLREIALGATGGKFEMISRRKKKLIGF